MCLIWEKDPSYGAELIGKTSILTMWLCRLYMINILHWYNVECHKIHMVYNTFFIKEASSSNFFNGLFQNYIHNTFPFFTLIYTDCSVFPLSVGFSFFNPDLHISFTNNLPPIRPNALPSSNRSNSSPPYIPISSSSVPTL